MIINSIILIIAIYAKIMFITLYITNNILRMLIYAKHDVNIVIT